MGRLNRDWVAGVMLVVAGFILLGTRLFPDLVPTVPLIVGLAILVLFLLTRSPGALINGAVTVGIGVGVLVVKGGNPDLGAAGFIISVAGGFYLAWILGVIFDVPSIRWWPVVPGSLLLAAGAVVYSTKSGTQILKFAVDWWPGLLVLMGIYLLLRARFRSRIEPDDETSAVPVSSAQHPAARAHPAAVTAEVHARAGALGGGGGQTPVPGQARPLSDAHGGHFGGDRPGSVERT